jgi:beta-carotene 15,15'-dioxygenase
MIQILLIITGVFFLVIQQFVSPIPPGIQFNIFFCGIILLGIPHGAADLLVAAKNTDRKPFSNFKFFAVYLGKLFAFAGFFWIFPVAANLIFIFFAAYHFGETDLNKFKTDKFTGKFFVTSYGLLILSVILLTHFEDVRPILLNFKSAGENILIINWIDQHRYILISLCGTLFFASAFIYFLKNNDIENTDKGQFLVRFAIILVLLFNMPMVLGFTFYFIVWHSVLSLINIINYLKGGGLISISAVLKQIGFFSFLAITGIGCAGYGVFKYMSDQDAMAGYIFIGLAVLTAPHMSVMHNMYIRIRQVKLSLNN